MNKSRVKKIIQFNIEDPKCTFINKKVDPREIVSFVKKVGADTLIVFARDGWGYAFYKSKIYPVHGAVSEDFLEQLKALCDEEHIDLVLMVCHTSNKFLAEKHPEYVQRDKNGNVIYLDSKKHKDIQWPLMCINSRFLDICFRELEETKRFTRYFMLDSFRYQPDPEYACYCDNCKEKFKQEKGKELKPITNWVSDYFWEVWEWRYTKLLQTLSMIKSKIKEVNGKLIYNAHPIGWNWRNNTIVERSKDVDIVFAEASESDFQPLGFLIEITKLVKGLASGKEVWTSRNAFHIFSTPKAINKLALEIGIWEIVSGGGNPLITMFLSTYIFNKNKLVSYLKDVFRKVEKVSEYISDMHPFKEVLVLYSNSSRDYYGKMAPDQYNNEVRGFFYALLNMHYQVDFIGERNLNNNNIKNYLTLILPNFTNMEESHLRVLKKYKGRILATYLTSMYDKYVLRDNFLASDLFGCDFLGIDKDNWFYVRDMLFGDYNGDIGYVVRVKPKELSNIMYPVRRGLYKYGYEYTLGISPPPAGKKVTYIMRNKNIVYVPFQFGKALFKFGYLEYYNFLKNLIGIRPMVDLDGYETLRTILWENRDSYALFLINETTSRRTLISNPTSAKFLRGINVAANEIREVIPLKDVVIRIRDPEIRKAKLLFANRKVEVKSNRDYIEIKIPRIDLFDLLILEK